MFIFLPSTSKYYKMQYHFHFPMSDVQIKHNHYVMNERAIHYSTLRMSFV